MVASLPTAVIPEHPAPRRLPDSWDEVLDAPALVINLDRRPDRMALAAAALREAGFRDVRRVRAIDGQDADVLARAWAVAGSPPLHPGDPMFASQPGRQGCFLSQALVWSWMVEHGVPVASIFEDDLLLHSRWRHLAPAFYASTPREVALLYLGGLAEDPGPRPIPVPSATHLPAIRPEIDWSAAPGVLRVPAYKTGAFTLTIEGARNLLFGLRSMPGGVYSIDNMMNHLQRKALSGTPGADLEWAIWNGTAAHDPDLAWLPQQRQGETGLVFQRLELGTDVDPRWRSYAESVTASARALAQESETGAPPTIDEQVAAARASGVLDHLPVIDLLEETGGWLLRGTSPEREALDAALAPIDPDRPDEMWDRLPDLAPAVADAQLRLLAGAGPDREVAFGDAPAEPVISAVIPVYEHFGEMERQLRAFASDPEARRLEVVYVLDSPWREREFLDRAGWLHRLLAVPFRVMVMNRNAGYSAACNAGVAASRGATLLLLNSDAWPSKPGWIGEAMRFFADHPDAGLLGPKLMYPDGRVHGDGCLWTRHSSLPCWVWTTANWGVPGSGEAVQKARVMPAMGTAAVLVRREPFLSAGGFSTDYAIGQFEDCDLSCRIADLGRDHWFLPDLEFMHEESRSYHGAERRRHWLLNAWVFAQRWGAWLDDRQGR